MFLIICHFHFKGTATGTSETIFHYDKYKKVKKKIENMATISDLLLFLTYESTRSQNFENRNPDGAAEFRVCPLFTVPE